MIYRLPSLESPLDQGDLIQDCPLALFESLGGGGIPEVNWGTERVLVLTQTCDLAQGKTNRVVVAAAVDAEQVVLSGQFSPQAVQGQVRMARVYGWYFLPADDQLELPELIIDFNQLHSLPRHLLEQLCRDGHRVASVQTPFREHLAKHFADTYSRIGLPEPYATQ
ncbi:MAG: hypothetical protein AB7U20_06505 [Planctomycetaceae bacterium]